MRCDELRATAPRNRRSREIELRQRGAVQQAGEAAQPGAARRQLPPHDAGANPLQMRNPRDIFGRVDKGREMDPIPLGEVPQHVPGPDLVALVGRIRDPVRKKQDILSRIEARGHLSRGRARSAARAAPPPPAAAFSKAYEQGEFRIERVQVRDFLPAASLN